MKRPLRIAHVSDLHIGKHDAAMLAVLAEALAEQQADIILLTGDVVDSPTPGKLLKARGLLEELCKKSHVESDRLYLVPGNHDCRIKGLIPLGGVGRLLFRRMFNRWCRLDEAGIILPDLGLVLFLFDSNATLNPFTAAGRISKRSLNRFTRFCAKHCTNGDFKDAIKVALLHHHPLPIPNARSYESMMLLRNSAEFLRYLAEAGVDFVLHGHKHHRTTWRLSITDSFGVSHEMNVLSCPSSAERLSEAEERGFTLFTIHENRRIEACPFPYLGRDGFKLNLESAHTNTLPSLESYVRRSFMAKQAELGYSVKRLFRSIIYDELGDMYSVAKVSGLEPVKDAKPKGIEPSTFSIESGQFKDPSFESYSGVKGSVALENSGEGVVRKCKLEIETDDEWRRGGKPYEYEWSLWGLNSVALSSSEYESKYEKPPDAGPDWGWECNDLQVTRAFANIVLAIHLPPGYKFEHGEAPKLHIYPSEPEPTHPWVERPRQAWLAEYYGGALVYNVDLSQIILTLRTPPCGYTYRVLWPLRAGSAVQHTRRHAVESLRRYLLSGPPALDDIARAIGDELKQTFGLGRDDLEVTIMARFEEPGKHVAKLKVVGSNVPRPGRVWDYALEVGDGVAGMAFKTGKVWSYSWNRGRERGSRPPTYVPFDFERPHRVLYSIPLLYEDRDGPVYGVVNVGSYLESNSVLDVPGGDRAEKVQTLIEAVIRLSANAIHDAARVPTAIYSSATGAPVQVVNVIEKDFANGESCYEFAFRY